MIMCSMIKQAKPNDPELLVHPLPMAPYPIAYILYYHVNVCITYM